MDNNIENREFDRRVAENKVLLEMRELTYEELLHFTACSILQAEVYEETNQELNSILDEYLSLFSKMRDDNEKSKFEIQNILTFFIKTSRRQGIEAGLKLQKRLQAIKGATARHTENRSIKEQAIQYYKHNHKSFTDKNAAAFYIAQKIVPSKFSTVRDWLKGVYPE